MTRNTYVKVPSQTLKGYKRQKVSVLNQLGFHVDKSIFDKATTEIQVDNIAHSIIVS